MTKPTVPLEGQRILQIIPAEKGWKAWFNGPEDTTTSRPVACWAWIEVSATNERGAASSRTHEVVPFVCGGIDGLTDASVDDGYFGISGPDEEFNKRLSELSAEERKLSAEEDEDADD